MTKEELEKEAEDYAEQCYGWTNNDLALDVAKATYITSAEPRERQITGLSKHILELQKDKGNLIDRVRELEQQIEIMKCCEMCKHKNLNWGFSPICEARDKIKIENPLICRCDKWEIKEK